MRRVPSVMALACVAFLTACGENAAPDPGTGASMTSGGSNGAMAGSGGSSSGGVSGGGASGGAGAANGGTSAGSSNAGTTGGAGTTNGGTSAGSSGDPEPGTTGMPCTSDADCVSVTSDPPRCMTTWAGGYCSTPCVIYLDCAGVSDDVVCGYAMSERQCLLRCSAPGGCRAGYVCSDTYRACVPET
jgi:hypothetical protein